MKTSSHKKQLVITSKFTKDLKKLPNYIVKEAYNVSQKLCVDPFHNELDVLKLTGFSKIYRVIIKHDYRLIFTFDELNIIFLRLAHRKDIYKNLEF